MLRQLPDGEASGGRGDPRRTGEPRSSSRAARATDVCPGGVGSADEGRSTTSSSTDRTTPSDPDPGDDRRGSRASRHARGLRRRPASRSCACSSPTRAATSSTTITRELALRGQTQDRRSSASAEPILQHFAIVLDGEIRSFPTIDFDQYPDGISGNSGARSPASARSERGEGPRARAPDRRAAAQVRAGRPDGRLGDARRGLAPPGRDRRHRRPRRRRARSS